MRLAAAEPFAATADLRPLAEEVFGVLHLVRFARTASLLAFAGPSGLTSELLDRWINAGLIHIASVVTDPVHAVQEPYACLTKQGARMLMVATGAKAEGVSMARLRRSSQKRSHELGVSDFALGVLSLARDGRVDLLGIETDDRKIGTSAVVTRDGTGARRVALQADLLVAFRTPSGPSALLVEIDRGTVSVAKMEERYQGYLAWHREGGPERDFAIKAMRVLTVAPDAKRLRKLHDAALSANDGRRSGFVLFAEEKEASVTGRGSLLDPIAHSLGGTALVPVIAADDRGTSGSPGTRVDREHSRGARLKSCTSLGIPVPQRTNRLPAVAASPQVPML